MFQALKVTVAFSAVLLAAVERGQAGMITVDPDGLPNFTNLTNAFAGVTITRGNGVTDILARQGLTGTQQFSLGGNPGLFTSLPLTPLATLADTLTASSNSANILRFDFDTATDFVSLDLIPNDNNDPGSISAFDSSGNLVGFDSFDGQNLSGVRNTLSVSGAGITTLLAGGDNIGNNLEIDTLVYAAPVPEPSSLVLLGIGACVASIGAARRRFGIQNEAQESL